MQLRSRAYGAVTTCASLPSARPARAPRESEGDGGTLTADRLPVSITPTMQGHPKMSATVKLSVSWGGGIFM